MIFPNNNIMIPNQMLGLDLMCMNNDYEWMEGFKMGVEELEGEEKVDNTKGVNVIYKTTQGVTTNLFFKYGTTIDEILKKYLHKINRPDLINQKEKITFIFNASKLKFGDKTKVEDFFKGILNPVVFVNIIHI